MEKQKPRITKLDVLIYIFLIIITLFLIIDNRKYNKEFENKIIEKNLIKNNLNNYKEQININNEDIEKIEENIIYLNSINDKTKEEEKKYYQNLKDFEELVLSGKSKYKIAYLTFDDGPYYLTYKYLDILKKYNAKATFFTIGLGKKKCYDNSSKDCTKLYKEIVNDGHTIANHTYSHLIFNGLYSNTNTFMNSVKKQENLIKEKTGITTNILRFPGGSATAGKLKTSIIKELRKNGYGWVDWTAQDGDGGTLKNKNQAWNTFKNSINSNVEVILFHDYNKITLSLLPDMIEYLEEKNYILLPLFYESKMVNK